MFWSIPGNHRGIKRVQSKVYTTMYSLFRSEAIHDGSTEAAAMQEEKITFFHHLGYESSPRQVYDALMMDGCEFLVATGTSNLDDGWHSTQKTERGARKMKKGTIALLAYMRRIHSKMIRKH